MQESVCIKSTEFFLATTISSNGYNVKWNDCMKSTILIRNQQQEKKLSKITQQKRKQVKEKKDDKLCPEEEKVARLYNAGKLKGKTFQSAKGLIEDLNQETIRKKNVVKTKMDSPPLSDEEITDIKKARKSKGKIYKTPEKLIRDLHASVANRRKTSFNRQYKLLDKESIRKK